MTLLSPEIFVSRLTEEIKSAAGGRAFTVHHVKWYPHSADVITVRFQVEDLYVEVERDRGVIELYVKGLDEKWHHLKQFYGCVGEHRNDLPAYRPPDFYSNEDLTESKAISIAVSAFVLIFDELKSMLKSPDAYLRFLDSEKRQLNER